MKNSSNQIIKIRTRKKTYYLSPDQIVRIQGNGSSINIYVNQESQKGLKTEMITSHEFSGLGCFEKAYAHIGILTRIHRSHIININYLKMRIQDEAILVDNSQGDLASILNLLPEEIFETLSDSRKFHYIMETLKDITKALGKVVIHRIPVGKNYDNI